MISSRPSLLRRARAVALTLAGLAACTAHAAISVGADPATQTLEATSPRGAVATFDLFGADPEGNALYTYASPASGSTFPVGTTTGTVFGVDEYANIVAAADFTVTVVDTIQPVLAVPANLTAEATGPDGAAVTFNAVATDAVGTTLVSSGFESPALPYDNGSYYLVYFGSPTSSDNGVYAGWRFSGLGGVRRGNGGGFGGEPSSSGQQSAYVQSGYAVNSKMETATTFPVVAGTTYTVSFHQARRAGDYTEEVTYYVTFNGPAGSTEVFRRTSYNGEGFAPYTATFTATVSGDYTLAFNADDSEPAGDGTFFIDDVTVFGSPVVASPASGSVFPLGTTTVGLTAADDAGNSTSGSFAVTVRDTTGPAIATPASRTVQATSAAGAIVNFAATATDLVDGNVAVIASQASGSTFAIGTTTVTLTAADSRGNTSTGSFTVTVTPPPSSLAITSLTPSITSIWPPNKKMVAVTLAVATSGASGAVTAKIISVTSNEPNGDVQWQITGPLKLNLLADRLGDGTGRIYTITVEARDAAGNVSTKTVIVTVPHDQGK